MPVRLRRLRTDELSLSELRELRALFDEAWQGDDAFDDDDWAHTIGGTHFVMEVDGTVRSHVSVVPRTLVTGDPNGHRQVVLTPQEGQHLGETVCPVHLDALDERGLLQCGGRHHHPTHPGGACGQQARQHPAHRAQPAVEGQFAEQHRAVE